MMQHFALQLKTYKPRLSGQEKRLADYLLAHQSAASQLSISQLAAQTGVSTATISRFAKALGYDNFQALRLALAQAPAGAEQPLFQEFAPTDDVPAMARKIFAANVDALQATSANLDAGALTAAVDLLIHAAHIGLYGLGASNIVALDGYHKFLRTAMAVFYAMDYHMQLMSMTHLQPTDAAVVISHSGEDRDAIALAQIAQDHQVPLIVITGAPHSQLAKMAQVVLVAVAEESKYRPEALHALIAEMTLMDTLFMISAIRTGSQTAPLFQEVRGVIDATRRPTP